MTEAKPTERKVNTKYWELVDAAASEIEIELTKMAQELGLEGVLIKGREYIRAKKGKVTLHWPVTTPPLSTELFDTLRARLSLPRPNGCLYLLNTSASDSRYTTSEIPATSISKITLSNFTDRREKANECCIPFVIQGEQNTDTKSVSAASSTETTKAASSVETAPAVYSTPHLYGDSIDPIIDAVMWEFRNSQNDNILQSRLRGIFTGFKNASYARGFDSATAVCRSYFK